MKKIVVFGCCVVSKTWTRRCILRRIPNCQLGGDGGERALPRQSVSNVHSESYKIFREKPSKITTLLKTSCTSGVMCDILKHALATQSWQCRGSGQLPLLPNHSIMDFTDAKGYYSKNENKIQHFFHQQFLCESQSPSNKFWGS